MHSLASYCKSVSLLRQFFLPFQFEYWLDYGTFPDIRITIQQLEKNWSLKITVVPNKKQSVGLIHTISIS